MRQDSVRVPGPLAFLEFEQWFPRRKATNALEVSDRNEPVHGVDCRKNYTGSWRLASPNCLGFGLTVIMAPLQARSSDGGILLPSDGVRWGRSDTSDAPHGEVLMT